MNKVLLVTGASRGIGAETARLAAELGYLVCINFLTSEIDARQLLESIQSAGHQAIIVKANISDENEVK